MYMLAKGICRAIDSAVYLIIVKYGQVLVSFTAIALTGQQVDGKATDSKVQPLGNLFNSIKGLKQARDILDAQDIV